MKNLFNDDVAFMSDAPGHDKAWLDELISVSGISYAPRMFRATPEMWMTTLFDEHRVETKAVLKIKELRAKMHTHNALSDAAAWVAADEAVRVWVETNDLAACEAGVWFGRYVRRCDQPRNGHLHGIWHPAPSWHLV
jgi:hypothetical protein